MRLIPRILRERRADGVLRLRLDYQHHALLVGERPAEYHEARVDQLVHEEGVLGPAGLVLERARPVPLSAAAAEHYKEPPNARAGSHRLNIASPAGPGTRLSAPPLSR